MRRAVWIVGALCAGLALYAAWLWLSLVQVQPHQRAVVQRGLELEVLEPGLHYVPRFGRHVTLYDTALERLHRVAPPLMVDGCPVTLEMTFNIDRLTDFHRAGGNPRIIGGIDAAVLTRADAAGFSLQESMRARLAALREEVAEIMPAGLRLVRLNADVGACSGAGASPENEAPAQQELERVPVDLIAAAAPLGAQRIDLDPIQLVSADGNRLELSGAAATFDVLDTELAETCFGTSRDARMADITVAVSRAGLREVAGGTELADMPRVLAEVRTSRAAQLEADCALRIGPMDYSRARLEWFRAIP